MRLSKLLTFTIIIVLWCNTLQAATAFVATVKSSAGDYTSLNLAETGLQNDLTAATIKVFSISASSATPIAAGETVLGQTSAATGVCVLVNAAKTQILIKTIAVSTFQSGEVVQKTTDATRTVTLSDAGDSPIIRIDLYAIHDTTATTILGWTTSSTNYIQLSVPAGQRHTGTWDTSKYYLDVADGATLSIQEEYVFLDGLQITNNTPTGDGRHVVTITAALGASNDIRISNSILRGHGNASFKQNIINEDAANTNLTVWNTIIFNVPTAILNGSAVYALTGATMKLYSVTSIGGYFGLWRDGTGVTVTIKNCYFGGSSNGDYHGSSPTATTSASSDTTAAGSALDSIPVSTATFTNVTATTENYSLVTGSGLVNVGTDTSGDAAPLNFTDDIAAVARTGTWEIGAFTFTPAAAGIPSRSPLGFLP